jgi:hypothetical protein
MNLIRTLQKINIEKIKQLESQQPLQSSFDFHGVTFKIYTNSPYMVDHLNLAYHYFERDNVKEPSYTLLVLEAGKSFHNEVCSTLFPGRKIEDHLLISRDLEIIVFLRDCPLLAFYTVKLLFGQIVAPISRRFLGIHAASLCKEDRGLLLCGAARCGKTVLTALLLQRGFGYCSDDVTMIDRKNLHVVPFPRALNIREEYEPLAAQVLKNAHRVGVFDIADQHRLLVDLVDSVMGDVLPTVIFFPQFIAEAKYTLTPLSSAHALVALMKQRFYPLIESQADFDRQDFELLSNALESIKCYTLLYSDAVDAAQRIENIIFEKTEIK